MVAPHEALLQRLCGKEETLSSAKNLLNAAKSRTGPGSGHQLGAAASGLPAICAYLASERLGNDDVSEKVAQQASCLAPKVFSTTLNVVRVALAEQLRKRDTRKLSFERLARDHGLDDNVVYWMEEVSRDMHKGGLLEDGDFEENVVLCMIFYWTCIALHIRTVKGHTLMTVYGITLKDFQSLSKILDESCADLQLRIGEHVSKQRSARSAQSSPAKSTPSPSKTPVRRPQVEKDEQPAANESPLKRKTLAPTLSPSTPVKKPRVMATNLSRVRLQTTVTPQAKTSPFTMPASSPAKTYGSNRSLRGSSSKPTGEDSPNKTYGSTRSMRSSSLNSTSLESPTKAVGERLRKLAISDGKEASPNKTRRPSAIPPAAISPIFRPAKRGRRLTRAVSPVVAASDSDVEMSPVPASRRKAEKAQSVSSDDEEDDPSTPPPPCRHRRPPFLDRQFYHYRDPRVEREWELCEEHVLSMIERFGNPFDESQDDSSMAE